MIDNVWYECDISGEDVARCCKMGVSGEDVLGSAHGSSMSGVMIVELVDGAGFHGWNILSSHIVSKKAAKWHATSCNHQSIGGLVDTLASKPTCFHRFPVECLQAWKQVARVSPPAEQHPLVLHTAEQWHHCHRRNQNLLEPVVAGPQSAHGHARKPHAVA